MRTRLVIAGPGAGKTHSMVQEILDNLKHLNPCRYMVVTTYTNSAAENIRKRLSDEIVLPPNLFIGTIHSFINKFIVIPFASFNDGDVSVEKVFIQCGADEVLEQYKRTNSVNTSSHAEVNALKSRLIKSLNKKGFICYDQTLSLGRNCILNESILNIVANRIQFLFVDEFQDTGSAIFKVVDELRKKGKTIIYCVGDPEQYIQGFDSSIRAFRNLPIIKALANSRYNATIRHENYRCSNRIVEFLNNFNGRQVSGETFRQEGRTNVVGEPVCFLMSFGSARSLIDPFNRMCNDLNIPHGERCIITKTNRDLDRIRHALGGNWLSPNKQTQILPIKAIVDTILGGLNMNHTQYCAHYKANIFTLRKHAIAVLKAMREGIVSDENTFVNFLGERFGYTFRPGVPIKIDNIKVYIAATNQDEALITTNIHTIKGLEAKAVLAVASKQTELLKWLETDRIIRDSDGNDVPRLGYVAFSRAQHFLCIGCLEQISEETMARLTSLGVRLIPVERSDG